MALLLEQRLREPEPSPPRPGVHKILEQLVDEQTDGKSFKELCDDACGTMKERTFDTWDADALSKLGEILLLFIKQLVREKCEERWKGTLQLIEVFGERQEWRTARLPGTTISDLMTELLRLLNGKDLGKPKLPDVNMCFVKCLTNLPSAAAYGILLGILKDEEKSPSLLVSKCLKKVERGCGMKTRVGCSEEQQEKQARSAMEVVLCSRQSVLTMTGPARRQAWIDGAKEVVEIARRWLPEVVDECFSQALADTTSADDQTLLQEIWGKSATSSPASKENLPLTATDVMSKHSGQKGNETAAPMSSPCAARNERA